MTRNACSATTLQTYNIIFSKAILFMAISRMKRISTQETISQSTYRNAQCKNSRITRFLLILHPVFRANLLDENVRYKNPSLTAFSFTFCSTSPENSPLRRLTASALRTAVVLATCKVYHKNSAPVASVLQSPFFVRQFPLHVRGLLSILNAGKIPVRQFHLTTDLQRESTKLCYKSESATTNRFFWKK